MMRFLVDSLFDRELIQNYSLKEMMTIESEKIRPIFTYVVSYFKLESDSCLRASLSDKLSHIPGRSKRPKISEISDLDETL